MCGHSHRNDRKTVINVEITSLCMKERGITYALHVMIRDYMARQPLLMKRSNRLYLTLSPCSVDLVAALIN